MKAMHLIRILLLASIMWPMAFYGQEEAPEAEAEGGKHDIGITLSHSFISKGSDNNGGRKLISVPSWGLKYNYHISHKWAVGWHNDLLIERFVIERSEEEGGVLVRDFPVASLIMATHKPGSKGWAFAFGAGIELEENESFGVLRAGIEYGLELPKLWEVAFEFNYDIILEAYDSFNIGVGIHKHF